MKATSTLRAIYRGHAHTMKPAGAKETVDSILNEVQLLHGTDHPCLIKLEGVTKTVNGMLHMVPEPAQGIQLCDKVIEKKASSLTITEKRKRQIILLPVADCY